MSERIRITINYPGSIDQADDYVKHVGQQISEGFTSGHTAVDHHWNSADREQVRADLTTDLTAFAIDLLDAYEEGDIIDAPDPKAWVVAFASNWGER